ncbi:hypothetical protein AAVH_43736 [Aphelenchoides avenae]|nr:hypothetical protein AAVH_43736 [Aphelenchus avenae]
MKCNLQSQAEFKAHELKIQELEQQLKHANSDVLQDSHQRIVFLEQQLRQLNNEVATLRSENKQLQDLVDAFKALEIHENPGTRPSLKDRIEALGFYKDEQGRIQRRIQPISPQGFDTTAHYQGSTRHS